MRLEDDGRIPPHQPNCFGCGPDNPAGFGMQMRVEGDRVLAETTLDHRFEGAPGIAHGGALAALLDDLFGGVLVVLQFPAVTARLTVEYRAPVFLGRELALTGWCAKHDGRRVEMRGRVEDAGLIVAEAEALFVQVEIAHFERAGVPIPDDWRRWASVDPAA